MRRLQPVVWSKGTLLTPQHLQTQDHFLEDSLLFRIQSVTSYPWGFSRLEINPHLVGGGIVSISAASGIFPDGLLFDIPTSDPVPPAKPLAPYFEAGLRTIDLYLTVPAYREGGINVSAVPDAAGRFASELISVTDEVLGPAKRQIQVARRNLGISAAEENLEGKSLLPLARVERTRDNTVRLDPAFIPPLLKIRAGPLLVGMVRELVEVVGTRATTLGASRRRRNPQLGDFTITDAPRFWLLHTVNSYFGVLRHLLETGDAHPERLFREMIGLAGELTTFSNKLGPRDLPVYNHDHPSESFIQLHAILIELLKAVIPDNAVTIPLKPFRPFVYSATLNEERFFAKSSAVYLAVRADLNRGELIEKTPGCVRLWSANDLDTRVQQALRGVPLHYAESAAPGIPIKTDFAYFRVDTNDAEGWGAVSRARNIAAHVPAELPNPALELVFVFPSET